MRADAILTLSCPDRPGIVASVSQLLFEHGANIEESQQFDDDRNGTFFMRIAFSNPPEGLGIEQWQAAMAPVADRFGMDWSLTAASRRCRTLIMVSRFGHCLNDLLYRWQSGSLNVDLPVIVSNHPDLEPLARMHGIPFEVIPVSAATNDAAEARLRARFPVVLGFFDGLKADAEGAIDDPLRILAVVRKILGLARTAMQATTLPALRRELEFLRALIEDDLGLTPSMLGDTIATFVAEWSARLDAVTAPADAGARRRLRLTRAVLGRLQLRAALLRPPWLVVRRGGASSYGSLLVRCRARLRRRPSRRAVSILRRRACRAPF